MTPKQFNKNRSFLGLSFIRLAKEMGLDRRTVSKLEHGELKIRKHYALAMECLVRRKREIEDAQGTS